MEEEEKNYDRGINLTVRDLRDCLEGLPDDMDVIITITPEDDPNYILGFNHIRTAGILSNHYEPKSALCLAPSSGGLDMFSLIDRLHGDTTCEKQLF